MSQKYEGDVSLTHGQLSPGVECSGTYRLFNMETGKLHREGYWEGVYCGSSTANGMLYHQFLEAYLNGEFVGFFGQPAYRFQGVEWE